MSEILISLRGVTKVYGSGLAELMALQGIDLDISAGEFIAIMGPSGSGKSTAINIMGCLDTPSAGQYLFHGVHVESLSRDQCARLRRRYLGFVFQGFNLLARTSAQEFHPRHSLQVKKNTAENTNTAYRKPDDTAVDFHLFG